MYKISTAKTPKKIKAEAYIEQLIPVEDAKTVKFGTEGPVIMKEGVLWTISAEVTPGKWGKQWVMASPNIKDLIKRGKCYARLDSGCTSGNLGDITCDCIEQLRISQREILKQGGIVIHIPDHDGRGHGSDLKMANQKIMHLTGRDTIEVATEFYGDIDKVDIRTFGESALILRALGFPIGYQFDLGTKNPKKVNGLLEAGFKVVSKGVEVKHKNGHVAKNLEAKMKFFANQEKPHETH